MSLNRRNPRRDKNEPDIVQALKAQGFNVVQLSGKGVPDLLLSKGGQMWLTEVKAPKGTYKPAQTAFYEKWTGPRIVTLRSVEDALRFQLLAMEGGKSCT